MRNPCMNSSAHVHMHVHARTHACRSCHKLTIDFLPLLQLLWRVTIFLFNGCVVDGCSCDCPRVNDCRFDGNVVWCLRYFCVVCRLERKACCRFLVSNLMGGAQRVIIVSHHSPARLRGGAVPQATALSRGGGLIQLTIHV